jgi:hypothetical protein
MGSSFACGVYLQAEECLKQEEERVGNYLHPSTKPKLLKEVENEVLTKYEEQLLAKEHSGCAALLRDDKVGLWSERARCSVQSLLLLAGLKPCP